MVVPFLVVFFCSFVFVDVFGWEMGGVLIFKCLNNLKYFRSF